VDRLAALATMAAVALAGIGAPALVVSGVGPLAREAPPDSLVEPFLAVSPVNPDLLIASAMSTDAARSVVYVSHDGGVTWALSEGLFAGGDPMVTFDGSGRALLATLAPDFRIWRSDDAARTWHGPVRVGDTGRSDDREWLAAPQGGDRGASIVYGAAKFTERTGRAARDAILTTRSSDGGRTFSAPRVIREPSDYLQYVSYLFVRRDGTVVMSDVTNHARLEDGRYRGSIRVRTSRDGLAYTEPSRVSEYLSYGEAGGDRRWKGLGATPIAEGAAGTPFAGALFMVWAAPQDDRLQIVFSRSTDGGRAWTAPMRVNGGGHRANHSSPAIAVNHRGVIAVSWMDRRDDASDECFRPYVAVSTDGGRSFAGETRVTDAATCPGPGSRWMNGGETHGLVALPDGRFRMVWTAGDRRLMQPFTASIRHTPADAR
jgi:hypothetical protein